MGRKSWWSVCCWVMCLLAARFRFQDVLADTLGSSTKSAALAVPRISRYTIGIEFTVVTPFEARASGVQPTRVRPGQVALAVPRWFAQTGAYSLFTFRISAGFFEPIAHHKGGCPRNFGARVRARKNFFGFRRGVRRHASFVSATQSRKANLDGEELALASPRRKGSRTVTGCLRPGSESSTASPPCIAA